jgi:hypothetical protein
MFQLDNLISTKTDWTLVGGCPLIPHAFVASVMRSYASIYSEFVCHGFSFHYITAAPTNTVGDVMFYINKDRGNTLLDTTNGNFLSVVLSDPNTVMGPLWHNHTATYVPAFKKYTTNIFNDENLRAQGPGEVFVYTKTSASSTIGSPGYVLVDFDITFTTLQTSPRELTFPLSRLKYTCHGISIPATSPAIGDIFTPLTTGAILDGSSVSPLSSDPAARLGDIYKVVMLPDYGVFVNCTPANVMAFGLRNSLATPAPVNVTVDDGFTCYAVLVNLSNGVILLYSTYEEASAQSAPFMYGSNTPGQVFNIPAYFSLVGSVNPAVLHQSNY